MPWSVNGDYSRCLSRKKSDTTEVRHKRIDNCQTPCLTKRANEEGRAILRPQPPRPKRVGMKMYVNPR